MLKTLFKLFPVLDHLYIFQLFEYDTRAFMGWFLRNLGRGNLQKKHTLVWTTKAKLVFLLTLILLFAVSIWGAILLNVLWFFPLFLIISSQLSPFFLIISELLLSPIETFQKNKVQEAAREKIKKSPNLKVIAITGSFGKTSTKEILYTLLWKKYRVVKTPKSYNTFLGVSQTVLDYIKDNTDIFIAEIGAYKVGEITKIAKLIKPQIAVITAIAPQHLERFGSIDNIAKAKFELVESLDSNGVSILNKKYKNLVDLAVSHNSKTLFYGTKDSEFDVTEIELSIKGTSFLMNTPKGKIKIQIPLVGQHHAYNFLGAAAVALQLGLSLDEIATRGLALIPTPHRMEIIKNDRYTLIDNSFNTNLESSSSSFKLLGGMDSPQKIVITPGLIELGKETEKINKQFIKNAAQVADEIIIVGQNNKNYLKEGLEEVSFETKAVHFAKSTGKALKFVDEIVKKGGLVLIENDLPDQYR